MASIHVNFETVTARVAVDHNFASRTPEDPRVCLYLNDAVDSVCLEMTRQQFFELREQMNGAAETGLPGSLRWPIFKPAVPEVSQADRTEAPVRS
jgi:hypothetical protein